MAEKKDIESQKGAFEVYLKWGMQIIEGGTLSIGSHISPLTGMECYGKNGMVKQVINGFPTLVSCTNCHRHTGLPPEDNPLLLR